MLKKVMILTDGDADGVCAAAIARTSYPKAEVKFTGPREFLSELGSLSGYGLVIIMDLGINLTQKAEAVEAFRKLSKNSDIIYIDHHVHPPGVTKRSLACKAMQHKTNVSTSELALRFFKPPTGFDFIALLGAIGDYQEKTPRMRKLMQKYDERKAYPEALLLDYAMTASEDSLKRRVVDELAKGKWPREILPMEEQFARAVRRRGMVEMHVQEKAEKIGEHVMLVRDVPFEATGLAANLLTRLNAEVGIGAFRSGDYIHLSMRRRKGSDVNLALLIGEITSRLGGGGGGHEAAAGGGVPVRRFDEFLKEVKRALTGKKNTKKEQKVRG